MYVTRVDDLTWEINVNGNSVILRVDTFHDVDGETLTDALECLRAEVNLDQNPGIPYSGFMLGKFHLYSQNGLNISSGLLDPLCDGYDENASTINIHITKQTGLVILDEMIYLSVMAEQVGDMDIDVA